MKNLSLAPFAMTLLLAFSGVHAADTPGLSFNHLDWELACDNTRTCRAAGYQSDEEDLPVSVLLTRKAGPGTSVTAQLAIDFDGDEATFKRLPAVLKLAMSLNGQPLGPVALPKDTLRGELSAAQVAALLPALTRSSSIEWSLGNKLRWKLSDQGAAAVLLKMDDFQRRVGTPGALVRKGSASEDGVLPALPAPVLAAPPLPKTRAEDMAWNKKPPAGLLAALRSSLSRADRDHCADLMEAKDADVSLDVQRLADTQLLVATQCWMAAYNSGTALWVVNDKPPFKPELVTTSGTDYAGGVITSFQKGRGLGDCWSLQEWTWDGHRFVPTKAAATGLCKGIAGGAWELPTLLTDVRR